MPGSPVTGKGNRKVTGFRGIMKEEGEDGSGFPGTGEDNRFSLATKTSFARGSLVNYSKELGQFTNFNG